MEASTTLYRLARLREVLASEALAAVLLPSSDPHLSEYLPERWQARQWLSGFTGSSATLVVGRDEAALFTDSRYWEQAAAELAGSSIELVRQGAPDAPEPPAWLADRLQRGDTVGVDGHVLSLSAATRLGNALEASGIRLRTDLDPVAAFWHDRPGLPRSPIYEHLPPHAGTARVEKLHRLREAMQRHGATHHWISTLDDIAWLYNLRGSDVDYNPVFLGHALISADEATLFVGDGKVDAALQQRLQEDGVRLAGYDQAAQAVRRLGDVEPAPTLLLDPRRVTLGLREQVPARVKQIEAINPSVLLKSRKGASEAAHIRRAMADDGAAMCEFYAGFEAALAQRGACEVLTELTVDRDLTAARSRRPGFVGPSFPTIAGFAANGAMPHYRATPVAYSALEGSGLLLIDSGGQYLGGTTDITRVWPIGTVGAAERRDYTLVLKGMIALSRARFPRGTLSPMLDAIARVPLWEHGLDFGHGTGHGVGYFLAVHEGPQSISKAIPEPQMAIEPGMVTSIEPGVYRPGRWGVRIENLVLAVECETPEAGAFGTFLEFETLTLCPIDLHCIERNLLRPDEVAWLDAYHRTVRERLEPLVTGAALEWLRLRTEPLSSLCEYAAEGVKEAVASGPRAH